MKTLLIPSTSSAMATATTFQGVRANQCSLNADLVQRTLDARPTAREPKPNTAAAARKGYTILPSGMVILREEYDAESFFENYDLG